MSNEACLVCEWTYIHSCIYRIFLSKIAELFFCFCLLIESRKKRLLDDPSFLQEISQQLSTDSGSISKQYRNRSTIALQRLLAGLLSLMVDSSIPFILSGNVQLYVQIVARNNYISFLC